jgi:hypothetical protein
VTDEVINALENTDVEIVPDSMERSSADFFGGIRGFNCEILFFIILFLLLFINERRYLY